MKITKYHREKYKTLLEKIKDLNRVTHLINGLKESTVKMTILPKMVYRFSAVPIKTSGIEGQAKSLLECKIRREE